MKKLDSDLQAHLLDGTTTLSWCWRIARADGIAFGQVAPVKGVEGFNRASPVSGPTFVDATIGGKRLRRGARLRALAEWSFGGGARYCEACPETCQDCPARLNRPETWEGCQVWDLVGRLGGQLRVLPGAVIGWDMGAALSLGKALGVAPLAMAELLPVIEAVMVRKLNEEMAARNGPGVSP